MVKPVDDTVQTPWEYRLAEPDVERDPSGWYDMLRTECPVAKTDAFGGFSMLSTYADARAVLLNAGVFSSASGVIIPPIPMDPLPCVEQDEPEHAIYRKPMQSWFSPAQMDALEGTIRAVVTRLIDSVIDDRQGDLASVIAQPLPSWVIGMLLGAGCRRRITTGSAM